MKKWSLLTLLFLFACSPVVQMKVLKPAQLPITKPVKRLAVLDFEIQGHWNMGETKLTEKEIKILKFKFKTRKRVSSRRTSEEDKYSGSEVATRLIGYLVNNGYYQVVERSKLQQIIEEQRLALSGMIDESTAVEVGKLLGVEGILTGNGNYTVKDHGEWVTYTKKIRRKKETVKVRYKQYRVYRDVTVTLNFRIFSTETGEIIASNTITGSSSAYGSKEQPLSYFKTREDAKMRQMELEARQQLPHWKTMVDDVVDRLCRKITEQIAPHYVTVKRSLEKGKSDEMKMSIKYTTRGLWEDAKQIWEKIINTPGHRDRVAAMYNLGIYYEAIDKLDEAENLFDQCFKLTGKNKYLDARARVVRRKKELQKLQQQGVFNSSEKTEMPQ
jgi:curli biogenesis system outer membrane secretion channel CsgG